MLFGLHLIGAVLLLAASILILVVTITAPVIDHLSLLRIDLPSSATGSSLNLGTFGYCLIDGNSDGSNACSRSHIGYDATSVIQSTLNLGSGTFSSSAQNSARRLTRVMILHPIASGVAFIGALLAFASGIISALIASMIAFFVFLIAAVALICDFILFALLRRHVNDNATNGVRAHWTSGIWLMLAGTICALLASLWLFFTCCFARRRDHRARKSTI